MANLAVAIFLILFGVLGLVSTKIPEWVIPLAACIAGLVVLVASGGWWRRP